MTYNIEQTCCFTGHRPEKLPYSGIEVKRNGLDIINIFESNPICARKTADIIRVK